MTYIKQAWGGYSRSRKRITVLAGVVAAVLAIAAIAMAAIFLRAEISGQVVSGAAVAFEWGVDLDGSGPLTDVGDGDITNCQYAIDTDADGIYDTSSAIPSPLTCLAEIVGGELQISLGGGWLPGEAAIVAKGTSSTSLFLSNPSSVSVEVVAWDFSLTSGDVGLPGDGKAVTLITNAGSLGAYAPVALPTDVPAGTTFAIPGLIVEVSTSAPFATTFVLDGAAVVGETTR